MAISKQLFSEVVDPDLPPSYAWEAPSAAVPGVKSKVTDYQTTKLPGYKTTNPHNFFTIPRLFLYTHFIYFDCKTY